MNKIPTELKIVKNVFFSIGLLLLAIGFYLIRPGKPFANWYEYVWGGLEINIVAFILIGASLVMMYNVLNIKSYSEIEEEEE